MGSNTTEMAASDPSLGNYTVIVDNCGSEAWEWLYTMQPVYMMVICVLGMTANIFVLPIFYLHKKPCTVAEIYLCNLTIADLVFLSCLPFWAITVWNKFEWQFGPVMCRLVNMVVKVNMYCSIYSLVLVCFDRYLALVHAMSHGRMRRASYAKLTCLAIWGFSILMSIPVVLYRKVKYFSEYLVTACYLEYPSFEVEVACDLHLVFLGFLLPASVIVFCTCKIILVLRNQNMKKVNTMKREKATLLVLFVLLAFMLCWIPFHVVKFIDVVVRIMDFDECELVNGLDISNQVFTYLGFSNSLLNPILYVIVGKNFRKKVMEVFNQISQKRMKVTGSTRSNLSSTLKTIVS